MWLGVVTDMVGDACGERESTAVLQLGVQLPIKAQQNVPFATPMISEVARAVLDHSNPYRAELACAPVRRSSRPGEQWAQSSTNRLCKMVHLLSP